ncbi:endonuclease/exonuclease/phosphatase family protein [Haliangium sp.]|uniref:endonuclease/exonuclease/phosphatase family protein n=1 Tax=Haliangium sp. TaxID=2663208 RepID=UPI003D0C7F5F
MSSVRTVCAAWVAAALLLAGGCRQPHGADPVDAPPARPDARVPTDAEPRADANPDGPDAGDTGYPPPRTDLVDRVGSDRSIDIATWNLLTFPVDSGSVALAADIISSLDLDLVAVEEISDVAAFDELVARLPNHAGFYAFRPPADGFYQKVGFLYREDVLTLVPGSIDLLDTGDFDSFYAFPRPPMQARFSYIDRNGQLGDFTVIVAHLKAKGSQDDIERRAAAMAVLAQHMRDMVDNPDEDDEIILLGDLNQSLAGDTTPDPFEPVRDPLYRIHTAALHAQGAFSYVLPPFLSLIDHVISTSALDDEFGAAEAVIPRIDLDPDIADYAALMSDHLPVIVPMPVL